MQITAHLSWGKTLLFATRGCMFLALLAPLIFTNQSFFPTLPPQTIYFRVLVELGFLFYMLLLLESRRYLPKPSPLLWGIALFIGVLTLASLLGIHPVKSFWGTLNRMEGLIAFLHYGIFFIVLVGIFRKIEDWVWLFRSILFLSIPIGIMGLFEYLGFTTLLPISDVKRMEATFGNPALYGAYLLFVLLLGIFLTFWEKKPIWKVVAWSLVLINTSFLFLSGTRAAWVGVAFGLFSLFAAWFVLFRKKSQASPRTIFLGMAAALLIFFTFISLFWLHVLPANPFWDRYQALWNDATTLETQRFTFWPVAFQAWRESPILGYGLESFAFAYDTFYVPSFLKDTPELQFYDRAHNIFLELLVAAGLLGLAAYGFMLASASWLLWRIYRSTHSIFPFIFLALLIGYVIHTVFSFDTTISYSLLFLVFAFVHVWYREMLHVGSEKPAKTTPPLLSQRVGALLAALFLFGFLSWTANMAIWRATTTLAQGYYLQYKDPIAMAETLSGVCAVGPLSIRIDACDSGTQLLLSAPFNLYREPDKKALLEGLERNLQAIYSLEKGSNVFQMKHAILLAQGYEALYLQTQDLRYLQKEEEILKEAQELNPGVLPLYKFARTMYEFSGDKQKQEQFFKKALVELLPYLAQ